MFCKKCGTELAEGIKFCPKCGNPNSIQPSQPIVADMPTENKQTENKNTDAKIPKKKENKFLKTVASILYSIIIFVLSLSVLTLFTARSSLSPEKVENLLDSVDVEVFVKNIGMDNLLSDMTGKVINKIYQNTSIKDYVEDTANDYAEYMLGGDKPKGVAAEDVENLMIENQYDIEEFLGSPLKNSDFENTYRFFDEKGKENLGVLSAEVRTNETLSTVRMIMSIYSIILLLLLTALFIVLLLAARRRSLSSLVWIALTLIASAITFIVFAAVKPVTLSLLGGFNPIVKEIAELYMSNILEIVIFNAGMVIFTAALLIAIYAITKKIVKSKKASIGA